jgi:hypothetical protein
MWLSISLRLKLNQPLAVMLDRVFVDIALCRSHSGIGNSHPGNSLFDTFRDVSAVFERFSSLPELAMLSQDFRQAPVCFTPMSYSPRALYEAADLGACFAYRIGKLLEERLGMPSAMPGAGIEHAECDSSDFLGRVEQLTAQTGELLRSGDWDTVVLTHRMLVRSQALCALLAPFRQLRTLASSGLTTAPLVVTEAPLR